MIVVASPRLVSLMGHLLRGRWQAGCGEPALSWADWGEAWPPSGVSLPEGAHRPWAILAPVVGDIEANMATVSRRTGNGWPVRRPVAIPASRFGGSGLYHGHAPSYHHYVDAVLVDAVLAGFWESALCMAGFWESALFMVGFWESVLSGPASWSRPSRSFLGEGF